MCFALAYSPEKRNHRFGQKESEGMCRMRMKMIQRLVLFITAPLSFDGAKWYRR